MERLFHPQSSPVNLGHLPQPWQFALEELLISGLHPAGLVRDATLDNLSWHMWGSPLYVHLQWPIINIWSEPLVPSDMGIQAGETHQQPSLLFCFTDMDLELVRTSPLPALAQQHCAQSHRTCGAWAARVWVPSLCATITFHAWTGQSTFGLSLLSVAQPFASLSRQTTKVPASISCDINTF